MSIRDTNSTLQDQNIIITLSSIMNNISFYNNINKGLYISLYILIVYIIIGLFSNLTNIITKGKQHILNLSKWIKNMYINYINYTINENLPTHYNTKTKQSPFISAQQTPLILPSCTQLEKTKNVKVQFSIPYRRFQLFENIPCEEHRITITTVIQNLQSHAKV